jgi:hypothetical protein
MSDLVQLLHDCADDPMWADHCEMSKKTVRRAADALERQTVEIERLTAENAELRAAVLSACGALHGEGVNDQGEAWDKALRILDATHARLAESRDTPDLSIPGLDPGEKKGPAG